MPSGKQKIIIVDDDKAVRDSLNFSLRLEGLDVHTCPDGESLLAYPDLDKADCLVVDARMPGLDGFALRQKLLDRGVCAPMILITAPVTSNLRRKADAAGFLAVLEKPLLDNILLRHVHAATGG
jgi:two-component system, LuxR family, response regulator FixJ